MKKLIFTIILLLFMLITSAPTAFGMSAYTVDKVNIEADLLANGSALIKEEWTVTIPEDCTEGFVREIDKAEDNFEKISAISELSVTEDGNVCIRQAADGLQSGCYDFSETEQAFKISWAPAAAGTHVFSVRYVQSAAVKAYKGKAYFYFRAVSESSDIVCRDVTVKIMPETPCFSEDFEILEAGLLAGEKTDGAIKFSASNTAGLVKIGIAVNEKLFDTAALTRIEDDNTALIVFLLLLAVLLLGVCICFVFFALKYESLLRSIREKHSEKMTLDETAAKTQRAVFRRISPAVLLKTVMGNPPNPADFFIVTAIELFCRGYIVLTNDGFDASPKSMTDAFHRPLDKNEKRVIRLFSANRLSELVSSPTAFFTEIEQFNKNVSYASPFFEFSKSGRRLIRRCFEIKLCAKRFEFVSPAEISDSIFRNSKYTAGDLVISIINEQSATANNNNAVFSDKEFKRNLFMMRDIYNEGMKLTVAREEAKVRKREIR